MAEVVGPGDIDSIPPHVFKFAWWQTWEWSDGRERILQAGEDYPSWMSFEDLRKRLLRNAGRAKGKLTMWRDDQDRVHIVMTRGEHR